ncbi:MAG: hypothetical protein EA352_00545 [Gemmatimonadales bacterium]|nr:MAG: hypothetical protein EA352_00545 [Gemmatimonadales bacterium]
MVAGLFLVSACSDGSTSPDGAGAGGEGTSTLAVSGAISGQFSGTASFVPQFIEGNLVLLRINLMSDGYDPGGDTEGMGVAFFMDEGGQPIDLTTTSYPTGPPGPGYVGVTVTHRPGDDTSQSWITGQMADQGSVTMTHVSDDQIRGTVNISLRTPGTVSPATEIQLTGEFTAICPAPYC